MEITCSWVDEISVAKEYFDKNGWKLTSVEKVHGRPYKVNGGKNNHSITVYVIDGVLYEWDRFRYRKID